MNGPRLHLRLRSRASALGELLQLDDPTELNAALEDLQVLLTRCRYHLGFALLQRAEYRRRKQRRARLDSPGPLAAKRRGRRPGSANWAQRQLGLGLAQIWFDHTGRRPTRRHDGYGTGAEHGPFHTFVSYVLSALRRSLRATRKGHVPTVDYLVRMGIDDFNDVQRAPAAEFGDPLYASDEAQRRGIIDERRWLRAAALPVAIPAVH